MSHIEHLASLQDQENIRILHEQVAAALSLEFTQPPATEIDNLEDQLRVAATVLGVEPPSLTVPMRGFLMRPLSIEQQTVVAHRLDAAYGDYFTQLQDSARLVPIVESGERMVDIRRVFNYTQLPATFSDTPINPTIKDWGGKPRIYWARSGVVDRVVRAAQAYQQLGLTLHFEDGFRPEGVQEGLFQMVIATMREKDPSIDNATLLRNARSMIAISPWIAAHKSGAAIDYTLRKQDGTALDLGHMYLQLGAKVALDFPFVTWEQYKTRQLFAQVSRMAGLYPYPGEDWHVSADDAIAVINSSNPERYSARYGPIRSFDETTGEIIPYDPAEYYVDFDYS